MITMKYTIMENYRIIFCSLFNVKSFCYCFYNKTILNMNMDECIFYLWLDYEMNE